MRCTVILLAALALPAWAGTAQLSWTAPTQNVDGSAYTNPGGYRVYRRCNAEPIAQVADVPHTQLSWADTLSVTGTCWWSLTAYNALGAESARTNEVSKSFAVALPGAVSATFTWQVEETPDMALSDTGLVARYYFDEQPSGVTDGSTVVDNSSNGYDLTINDGAGTTDLEYTEVSGNRGLQFKDTAGDQRAYRNISDSTDAIRDLLGANTKWTIEVVLNITTGNDSNGRIFVINGRSGENPELGVTHKQTADYLQVYWEQNRRWSGVSLLSAGRVVLHIVYDTTQATENNRIKIYRDGTDISSSGTYDATQPAQDDTLDFSTGRDLTVGNRENSGSFARSVGAIIYYGALYNVAFDATRVSDHYDVLTADDDTPAGGAASLPPINRSARMAAMIAH